MEAILLIVLLILILFALKLAAILLVYHAGPESALFVILICIAIAKYVEPTGEKPG